MALSGAIVTDASGTGVFFGSPSQSVSGGGSGYTFDVTDSAYGAVGDGVTDDTAEIQEAIDAAAAYTAAQPTEYAIVFIPEGVYVTAALNVTGDRIRFVNRGLLKLPSGDTTSAAIIDVTGDDFSIEGGTLDGNSTGHTDAGHCLRMAGDRNHVSRVTARNAKSTGIVAHVGSNHTTIENCLVRSCPVSVRVRGDNCKITYSIFLDFASAISEKGVIVDPVVCDAQYFGMFHCYFKTANVTQWNNFLLIDPGDGGYAEDGFITCGTATNSGGKAKYTIQAGHGYHAGDGFLISGAVITPLPGHPLEDGGWNVNHKVIGTTGDVFCRVASSTTFTLYDTAAHAVAGGATGLIDITAAGTSGQEFYVTTANGGRQVVQNDTGVNTGTDVLTTDAAHGFLTGEQVRLTPRMLAHLLPTGLQSLGSVTLNTPYQEAGSASTSYQRHKRIETVELSNLVFDAPGQSSSDADPIKINNVNNLRMECIHVNHPPDTANTVYSLRLGGNNRLVNMQNCDYAAGMIHNVESNINRLRAEICTFGDGHNLSARSIQTLQAQNAVFKSCVFRTSATCVRYDYRDEDLEYMEFDDCVFEGHGTSRTFALAKNGTYTNQLVMGGKILFRQNNVRRNMSYTGITATFDDTGGAADDLVTISSGHTLRTGDAVYFTADGGTLPTNVVSGTVYYARVLSSTTFTVHTTRSAASLSSSTPFNFGSDGSGALLCHSPTGKIGMALTGVTAANVLLSTQGSVMDLEDVVSTNITSTGIVVPAGTRIWNPNAIASTSPGWIVSQEGVLGSSGATVKTMAALGA